MNYKNRLSSYAKNVQSLTNSHFDSNVAYVPVYGDRKLFTACDGVGTKLAYHIKCNTMIFAAKDLVAMVANDLYRYGIKPIAITDYYTTNKLDELQYKIFINGIASACNFIGCALTGGEIAEHLDYGVFDCAATAIGTLNWNQSIPDPNRTQDGDVIIGLKSSGLHANGFSIIRKIFTDEDLHSPFIENDIRYKLLHELIVPTAFYPKMLNIDFDHHVRAAAHITGGGLIGKLGAIIPDGYKALLKVGTWDKYGIFDLIRSRSSLSEVEMFSTFNMGIGMALVCNPSYVDDVCNILSDYQPKTIGWVVKTSENHNKVVLV